MGLPLNLHLKISFCIIHIMASMFYKKKKINSSEQTASGTSSYKGKPYDERIAALIENAEDKEFTCQKLYELMDQLTYMEEFGAKQGIDLSGFKETFLKSYEQGLMDINFRDKTPFADRIKNMVDNATYEATKRYSYRSTSSTQQH